MNFEGDEALDRFPVKTDTTHQTVIYIQLQRRRNLYGLQKCLKETCSSMLRHRVHGGRLAEQLK